MFRIEMTQLDNVEKKEDKIKAFVDIIDEMFKKSRPLSVSFTMQQIFNAKLAHLRETYLVLLKGNRWSANIELAEQRYVVVAWRYMDLDGHLERG